MTGVWWDAKNPTEKIAGTLNFNSKDGGTLTLVGSLGGIQALSKQGEVVKLIHGLADNKLVTLCESQTRSLSFNVPGPFRHELRASRIFLDVHLEEGDLQFSRIDISTEFLPEFVNHSSLTSNLGHDKNNKWTGAKAEVVSQKPIDIGSIKGGKAFIRFGWSQSGDNLRSLTLHESCVISIELNKKHMLDDLMSTYVRPIQDLVTLGTDKPNAITEVTLYSPDITREGGRLIPIKYYYHAVMASSRAKKDTLTRPFMLFTLNDLKPAQFNKWLNISKKFQPVVGIVFGQRYSVGIHIENRLINAVSAAEAYHRRRFNNTVLSDKEWKEKKRRIKSSVDKSEHPFLNDILQYANEKRLKSRLEEILSQSGLKGDLITDPDEWNKEIRSYRNTLTHYDPKSPTEITDYERVYQLSDSLLWVILACLMIEMGFSKTTVHKLLSQNQRYIFTKERLRDPNFTGVKVVTGNSGDKK